MFIRSLQTRLAGRFSMCLIGLVTVLVSAGAEANQQRWITTTAFFERASACMSAGMGEQVCQSAERSAYRQHLRIAPAYAERAECEADFEDQACVFRADSEQWTPWLSGFSLTTRVHLPLSANTLQPHRQMPVAYMRQAWTQGADGDAEPLTTARVQYFSEPLYWERAMQGGSQLTTLQKKLRIMDLPDAGFDAQTPIELAPMQSDTRQVTRHVWPQRLTDINAQ